MNEPAANDFAEINRRMSELKAKPQARLTEREIEAYKAGWTSGAKLMRECVSDTVHDSLHDALSIDMRNAIRPGLLAEILDCPIPDFPEPMPTTLDVKKEA